MNSAAVVAHLRDQLTADESGRSTAQENVNYLGNCVRYRARPADESDADDRAGGYAAVRPGSAVKPKAWGSGGAPTQPVSELGLFSDRRFTNPLVRLVVPREEAYLRAIGRGSSELLRRR